MDAAEEWRQRGQAGAHDTELDFCLDPKAGGKN